MQLYYLFIFTIITLLTIVVFKLSYRISQGTTTGVKKERFEDLFRSDSKDSWLFVARYFLFTITCITIIQKAHWEISFLVTLILILLGRSEINARAIRRLSDRVCDLEVQLTTQKKHN